MLTQNWPERIRCMMGKDEKKQEKEKQEEKKKRKQATLERPA